uniref:(deoxy)nucleoside triphosphate pyrophosphohydrolase n=1 Tax=uncultured Draconibacterium sp. TaxID=1573823 RepID=UPI00321654B1
MIQVTCAFVFSNDKILLAQNGSESDHPMQWEFPGGKIKQGETEEQCIRREILEELELKIEIVEALQAIEHDYGMKRIRLIPFVCVIKSGSLKLNDHIKTEWVKPDRLNEFDLSEADKKLIELAENRKVLEKYAGKQMH